MRIIAGAHGNIKRERSNVSDELTKSSGNRPSVQQQGGLTPAIEESPEARKERKARAAKRNLIAFGVLVGIIILVMLLGKLKPEPPKKDAALRLPVVEVEEVALRDVQLEVQSQGTVQSHTSTTLSAEVSGKIVDVSPAFVEGGFFRQGDVLVTIDPSDYEVAVKRAEASLAGAEARYAQEVARAEQARKDWDNLNRSATPSDLLLRKPQLAETSAAVDSAKADLEKAKRDLQRTRVTAPYDGLIKERRADLGQFVTTGSPMAVVLAVDYAEVRLPLKDQDLRFVQLPYPGSDAGGAAVELSAEIAGQVHTWSARISRSQGVVDEKTRVVYAVARIDDPYGLQQPGRIPLQVGTFVNASIDATTINDVYQLPPYLVKRDQVHVVDPESKLRLRDVEVVHRDREHAYVRGLDPSDRLAKTIVELAVDGMDIRVAGEAPPEDLNDTDTASTDTADVVADAQTEG